MPKNIVICCDGTNNSFAEPFTNIAHLKLLADIGDDTRQLTYYDPGVGVEADPRRKTKIGEIFSKWSGSAFGSGLVDNVQSAYDKLIRHYADGDQVYVFGFSRGAYTVRVLAGLLKNYGLLRPEHIRQAPHVVKAFRDLWPTKKPKDANDPKYKATIDKCFAEMREIKATQSRPAFNIRFMGVFDTVSSVGWAFDPKTFASTKDLGEVTTLRHAMALDERRAKFRTNRVDMDPVKRPDHQQIWFAGVHSDVGGGYEPPNNRLARVPLGWMLREARHAGMLVNADYEKKLDLAATRLDDEQGQQNESLKGFWNALEHVALPYREKLPDGTWRETERKYKGEGWRRIDPTFDAHDSLQRRRTPPKNVNWAAAKPQVRFKT